MMPAPIWATRPVTMRSVVTVAFEPPAPSSATASPSVASAVPWPRCSRARTRIEAVRAASSRSITCTVPP